MPRNKECRQRRRSRQGKRGTPGAPVPGAAQQTASEDSFPLPGFYYDSAKKRYFKINKDFAASSRSRNLREDLSSACVPSGESFSKIALLQQHGLLRRPFQTAALECKLKGLINISDFHTYSTDNVNGFTCERLVADVNGDIIAGMWRDENSICTGLTLSIVKSKVRNWSNKASRTSFAGISLDLTEDTVVPYGFRKPRDTYMVLDSEDRCLLLGCLVGHTSTAFMLDFSVNQQSFYTHQTRVLSGKDVVYSCTYSRASQRAAFGMGLRGLVCNWVAPEASQLTKVYTEGLGVFSTAFDSSGDVLYCGSRSGKVFCSDLRCDTRKKCTYSMSLKPRALRALHVLNDNVRMVVSGDENQLLSLDLRARRPLVTYEKHVNDYMKIPFSVDENLGVLCSIGQDCRTRLWNLNSGRIIGAIESPGNPKSDEIPFAVFKSSWDRTTTLPSVVIGCGGKMYIYHV